MILIVDSFFTGSHKYWGIRLQKMLDFEIELLTLSGKHWKWRMEGGAYELAQKFKTLAKKPKIIIATDMVNIPLFYAFSGITEEEIPCVMYFHENQFSYPISNLDTDKKQGRDNHYSFINLTSALFASQLVFNSKFNKNSFFHGAQKLISKLPDNKLSLSNLNSSVIYPGIEQSNKNYQEKDFNNPTILWNHRWEHDKNPELFIRGLEILQAKGIKFKLIILGKGTDKKDVKTLFENKFSSELIHCGYLETREEYLYLVSKATHLPVTSKHDFFGLSVAEAMNLGCFPILPNHQAYPEHLSNNDESGLLYDFPNGFFQALESSLKTYKKVSVKDDFYLKKVMENWSDLINKLN